MILELQIAAEYKVRVDYTDPRQLGLLTQTDVKKQKGAKPTPVLKPTPCGTAV